MASVGDGFNLELNGTTRGNSYRIDGPQLGHDPYQGAVAWGQTAYFNLDVGMLKHMATSRKLDLDVRATKGSIIHFAPTLDTRPVLTQYLQARGITGD